MGLAKSSKPVHQARSSSRENQARSSRLDHQGQIIKPHHLYIARLSGQIIILLFHKQFDGKEIIIFLNYVKPNLLYTKLDDSGVHTSFTCFSVYLRGRYSCLEVKMFVLPRRYSFLEVNVCFAWQIFMS